MCEWVAESTPSFQKYIVNTLTWKSLGVISVVSKLHLLYHFSKHALKEAVGQTPCPLLPFSSPTERMKGVLTRRDRPHLLTGLPFLEIIIALLRKINGNQLCCRSGKSNELRDRSRFPFQC